MQAEMTATAERGQTTRSGAGPGSPSEGHESDDDDMRLTITDTDGGATSNEEAETSRAGCSSIGFRSASSTPSHRCHVCGEAATSAHGLSLHLRRVHDMISCTSSQLNPTQHTCKLCGKSLSSASSLDRHMLVHSGERPFKCKICGMAFTTNGNMHRHMRTHSGAPLIAPFIGQLHVHGQLVQVHPPSHGSPVPPSTNQTAPQDFRCLICGRLFLSKTALEKHALTAHDDASVSCPKCFTRCASYSGLINGLHTCIEQPSISSCSSNFNDLTNIDFSCSKFSLICAVECDRRPRRCPPAVGGSDCERCGRSFPSKDALDIHKQRHDERQTFCAACRTSYMSSVDLQRHQAEFHRELADDKARLMAALQLHATNTGSRHDLSDVQTLLSLANTVPAIRTSSVGEPTSENSCDSLTDSTLLGVTASGEVEETTCTMCGLAFKNVQLLKRHLQLHANAPFACTLCPYISTDKSTLVRHLRTHNGERPFQCAICKYAFTTKANCERHVRKRHNKQTKAEIRSAMQYNPHMQSQRLSPTFSAQSDSGSTVCKYCNKDFKFNRVLRHHLRSLNNSCSRKPFCCIVCKLGFSTKNNCIRHVLKQHPEFQHKLSEAVSSKPLPADEANGQDPPVPLTFDNDNEQEDHEQDVEMEDIDDDASSDHIVPRIEHPENHPIVPKTEILKPTAVILGPVNQVIGTLHKVTVSPVAIDVVKSVPPLVLTTVNPTEVEVKKTPATPEVKITVIPAAHQNVKEAHPGKIEPPPPPQDEPLDLAVHALDLSRKDDSQRSKPVPSPPKKNFIDAILTAANYVPETPTISPGNDLTAPKISNDSPPRKEIDTPLTKTFFLSDKTRTALKILVNAKKSDERAFDEQEQHDLASVSALLNAANSHLMLQHMIGENEKKVTVKVSRSDPVTITKKSSAPAPLPTGKVEHKTDTRKDGPNSVSCKYCRRKFPWTSSLRRHMLTHTGQKPFKCPHCPIYFTTKSNCERHLLRKHDKLAKASRARGNSLPLTTRSSTLNTNPVVNVASRRMRVPCPCCSRSFRSEDSLAEHLYQPGKPFRCVICCELFREAQECAQHVRRVHDLQILHQSSMSSSADTTESARGSRCFACLQPVEAAGLQAHFRSAHSTDSDDNNNNSNSSSSVNNESGVFGQEIDDVGHRASANYPALKPSA